MPVKVTVKDEDMRIEFVETKKLYDLPKVGPSILAEVQKQLGQPVIVACGTGLKAAAPGESFPCQVVNKADATDRLTIDYKVGPMDGADRWEPRKAAA